MAHDSIHPSNHKYLKAWRLLNRCYDGPEAISEADIELLPMTEGMEEGGNRKAYEAYKRRAVFAFPDLVSDAVDKKVGSMHNKPPGIELPDALEPMRERATRDGESLAGLLRSINEVQIRIGRLGLLGEIQPAGPTVKQDRHLINIYEGECVMDWGDRSEPGDYADMYYIKLNESGAELDESTFEHEEVIRYRVLAMVGPKEDGEGLRISRQGLVYATGVMEEDDSPCDCDLVVPSVTGRPLERIPFVFVNAHGLSPTPRKPPLLPVAYDCINIYSTEAGYRQQIHGQGQDLLFTKMLGLDEGKVVPTGVGAAVHATDKDADAKYVGLAGEGLAETRTALENDYKRAEAKVGTLVSNRSGDGTQRQSGESLKTQIGAATITLKDVAETGAAALEQILRIHAIWAGANPDEVKVKPNMEFADEVIDGAELKSIADATLNGFPLSRKSQHAYAVKKGLTEMTYEEELEQIELERDTTDPVEEI